MSFRFYAIIIIFALFILILIINPRLSCFGRWIKSPLYPLLRKRKQKQIKTEDYGFKLTEGKSASPRRIPPTLSRKEPQQDLNKKNIKTQDYGFKLSEGDNDSDSGQDESGKKKA
jgi:hypothetical protein